MMGPVLSILDPLVWAGLTLTGFGFLFGIIMLSILAKHTALGNI